MWNNLKHQSRDKTDLAIGSNIGNFSFRARAEDRAVLVAFAFFCFQEKIEAFHGHYRKDPSCLL